MIKLKKLTITGVSRIFIVVFVDTECDTDLDSRREMTFFESILTTFEVSFVS